MEKSTKMNWLIYIFGYPVFFIIFVALLSIFNVSYALDSAFKGRDDIKALTYLIPSLAIWIWICFKFISKI